MVQLSTVMQKTQRIHTDCQARESNWYWSQLLNSKVV